MAYSSLYIAGQSWLLWIERWTCNPRLWVRISAETRLRSDPWARHRTPNCSPGLSTAPGVCVCVCVCVSTAPGVCVSTAPGVCVSTAPGVCALGWVKCREHISLLVILCIIVYVTNKQFLILKNFKHDSYNLTKVRNEPVIQIQNHSNTETCSYLCVWQRNQTLIGLTWCLMLS